MPWKAGEAMGTICMEGGGPLRGELWVQGAKNSVLPILAATILSGGVCRIRHAPKLRDVEAACEILQCLGAKTAREGEDLVVDTTALTGCTIPDALMGKMRSSVIFLGAILGRCGRAELSYPGGCELGPRPIDLHLRALRTMGAAIEDRGGRLYAEGALHGGEIVLSLPSVGATENAMLAACAAQGCTTIINAAREPEIVDLQQFLQAMGASVHGAGSSQITVEGGMPLHGCDHTVIADRIAAATYLAAVAGCGGEVLLRGVRYRHLDTVLTALMEAGCRVESTEDTIYLESTHRLRGVSPVRTAPYPGFPTDAQAVLMAALTRCRGTTVFVENMFSSRYRHVPQLQKMGADIHTEGRVAVVCGVEALRGASAEATDLRGGAALVAAGLQAQGMTKVTGIHHICRGYEDLAGDFQALGARIWQEDT